MTIRIGTRKSQLATWQANWVAERLASLGHPCELVFITTEGDRNLAPLAAIGGQGLFTKALQNSLREGEVDLAVHSLKDLPTDPTPGLILAASPEREEPFDAFLSAKWPSLHALPVGAKIGTGSLRRQAQLKFRRLDLVCEDVRGNLDTRIRKMEEGEYDAILLACAGLRRLGWESRIRSIFDPSTLVPAVGQGALGLECRESDAATIAAVRKLNHAATFACVRAERALLRTMRAGCLAPLGALCTEAEGRLELTAVVLDPQGKSRIDYVATGSIDDPEALGASAAEALLAAGGAELIASVRFLNPAP